MRILLAGLFSCLALSSPVSGEIIMAGAKKPLSAIVISPEAPNSVQLAANELQTHLETIGLGKLPISRESDFLPEPAIYLGESAASRRLGIDLKNFGSDAFEIRPDGDNLVIAGRDYAGKPLTSFLNPFRLNESYNSQLGVGAFGSAGTLFGVYHLLEKYAGIRWYMPGPLGTVWPEKMTRLEIPAVEIKKAPQFEQRHIYYGFFDRSLEDSLWYRRAGYGSPFPVAVSHSFAHFFMKYKETNPEYFAIINGEPDFGSLSTVGPGNFNLSNEGFVQQAIKEADQFFKDNPDQMIFPLCPNDGMVKISEDPVSQAQIQPDRKKDGGQFSNYVWGFINKVAEGVAKQHPDKLVGGIAYEQYGLPPDNITKLNSNVVVLICKARRSYFNPAELEKDRKRVGAWKEKVDRIYIWEYYCDILFNGGWVGYPVFYPEIVQTDLKALAGTSSGELIEAESFMPGQYTTDPESIKINNPGLQHPLIYVTGQLLWNPDLDLKALLDEYYRLFYGPAESEMRAFWTKSEKAWMNQKSELPADFFTTAQALEMVSLLREGREKTEEGSVYRQRIDLIAKEFTPATERAARLSSMEKPVAGVPVFPEDVKFLEDWMEGSLWSSSDVLKFLDTDFLPAKPPTHLRMGWNREKLYLAFVCFEPEIGNLIARVDQPDKGEIWKDDSVEVFLMKPGSETEGIQFIVNSKGKVWDAQRDATQLAKTQWTSNATARAQLGKSQWSVLVEIPWADLGVADPNEGLEFKANFYRNREVGKVSIPSSWAPLLGNSYYAPPDFGKLILRK